jgi:hypothetical protein
MRLLPVAKSYGSELTERTCSEYEISLLLAPRGVWLASSRPALVRYKRHSRVLNQSILEKCKQGKSLLHIAKSHLPESVEESGQEIEISLNV